MKKNLIDKKLEQAGKKFTKEYSQTVIDMVEDLYYNHGVRPSSRTILYRLKKLGEVTKKDVKKVEALVAYLKLTYKIPTYMMIDAKRSMYGTTTYDDAAEAISELVSNYKLDFWKYQENKILIMCEATGYTDVISKVADEYRCNYIGAGGDFSIHYKLIVAKREYTHIIYCGDMDAKGIEIPQILIRDINEIQKQHGYDFTTMVRIEHDVDKYDVELENVDVEHVRQLLRDNIKPLIDNYSWEKSMIQEERDIKSFETIK